jgi:hypothetical protein
MLFFLVLFSSFLSSLSFNQIIFISAKKYILYFSSCVYFIQIIIAHYLVIFFIPPFHCLP